MKVLVLAPHTDDESIGPGGAIARWAEAHHNVFCVAFSPAIESLTEDADKKATTMEFGLATKDLGIPAGNTFLHKFQVRHFPDMRREILELMYDYSKTIRPDLVLAPTTHNTHQDHQVIIQEANRAFRQSSLLGYELPRNNPRFTPQFYFSLARRHLEAKIQAVSRYASQAWRIGPIDSEPALVTRSLAVLRGEQAGPTARHAEAFEVIRWIK